MFRTVAVPEKSNWTGVSPQMRRPDMADNETILVADDDAGILQMLAIMLENAGYNVVTASDGEEALELVEARRPDLVLLDFMMPNMDGCLVCQLLKSTEKTRGLPVVIMSADRQLAERAMAARADDYLLKPFGIDEILGCLKSCLGPLSNGAD